MMTTTKIMRVPGVALLLSVAAWVSACVAERPGDCPTGPNVKIAFELFDNQGLFTDEIRSVLAVLFDGQGNYIPPATTLDRAALDRYTGMDMTLAPGDYRMVFWANVGNNTEIRMIDGTPALTYKDFDGAEHRVMGNGDPVWYAPAVADTGTSRAGEEPRPLRYYEFTVPASGAFTDRVAFTETHNTVNIVLGGLAFDPAAMPTVEITGLQSAANFWGMQPLDDPLPTITSAVQTVIVERDGVLYAVATFDTPLLGDMTGMFIVVKDTAGNELFRMPLTEAITQSGADPTAHEINQLLDFGDLSVTVEIWDWDDKNLGKEW